MKNWNRHAKLSNSQDLYLSTDEVNCEYMLVNYAKEGVSQNFSYEDDSQYVVYVAM